MDNEKRKVVDIPSSIRRNYHSLSEVQRRIADYILQNGGRAMYLSITELAATCGTSETTIMRFLRKIGFASYQVFRVQLAQGLQEENPKYAWSDIESGDSVGSIKEKVVSSTVAAVEDIRSLISDEDLESFTERVLSATRIFVFGVGSSAYIAGDLFHKLIRLGLSAAVCQDPHIMAIHSAQAKMGDLFIFVSHSGESEVLLDCCRMVLEQGGEAAAITSYPHSTLSELSQIQLLSSTNEMNYRPDAMTSRILQLVIIDLLTIILTFKLGNRGIEAIAGSQIAVARQKR